MERKKAFNLVAELYDKTRPPYHSDVFKFLIEKTQIKTDAKILEIGCGSGKATEHLLSKGFSLDCVEPGKNLLDVLAKKLSKYKGAANLYNQSFEEWLNLSYPYDLIIAAQSLHWVDLKIRYTKPFLLLKENGFLGEIFNFFLDSNEPFRKKTFSVIKKHVPKFVIKETENLIDILEQRKIGLNKMGLYKNTLYFYVEHFFEQKIEDYINSLNSWSRYSLLPAEEKIRIERELFEVLPTPEKKIKRHIATCLVLSQKK